MEKGRELKTALLGIPLHYREVILLYYNRAEKLLLARKTRQAAEELKRTLENDPDDVRALRTLARLYFSGGINFPKDRAQARVYLAELYRLTGKEWYLDIGNY